MKYGRRHFLSSVATFNAINEFVNPDTSHLMYFNNDSDCKSHIL